MSSSSYPSPWYEYCHDCPTTTSTNNNEEIIEESSKIHGRHLIAKRTIKTGQLIFIERPLLALQSLDNIYTVQICSYCKAYVGNSNTALSYMSLSYKDDTVENDNNDNNEQPQQSQGPQIQENEKVVVIEDVTKEEEEANDGITKEYDEYEVKKENNERDDTNENNSNNNNNNIIQCRYQCGHVYCSVACENDAWYSYHYCLCTGTIPDDDEIAEQHPLIQFKKYAVETNEILLLIAEWWIAQYNYNTNNCTNNIDYREISSSSLTTTGIKTTSTKSPIKTNTTTLSSSTSTSVSLSPYTDFLMNPWWDVVEEDMKTSLDDNEASTYIVSRTQLEEQQYQSKINNINDIIQTLHTICDIGSKLLSNVLNIHSIPIITSYDISIHIGSCEQNSMGIRIRNPLCRNIFDYDLRFHYHNTIINRLYDVGLIGDDNHDHEDNEDNENNSNDDKDKDGNDDHIEFQLDTEQKDHNDNDRSNNRNDDDDEINIINNNVEVEENDNDSSSSSSSTNQINHSVDDIALILSQLHFDEENQYTKNKSSSSSSENDDINNTDNNNNDDNDSNNNRSNDDDNDNVNENDNNINTNDNQLAIRMTNDNDYDDYDLLFTPFDGTAMYSIACKMNHSCIPNVIILYNKRIKYQYPLAVYCIALRDISINEELTISYIDTQLSYIERKKTLANYGFICNCIRCIQEKVEYDNNNSIQEKKESDDDQALLSTLDEQQQETNDVNDINLNHKYDDDLHQEDTIDVEITTKNRNIVHLVSTGQENDNDDEHDREEEDEEEKDINYKDENNTTDKNAKHDNDVDGETKLQQKLESIDTIFNHATYGTIPIHYFEYVSSFILQTGKDAIEILTTTNNINTLSNNNNYTIIQLLQQCIKAIEDRDYCMCKIVGCDLRQILFHELFHSTSTSSSHLKMSSTYEVNHNHYGWTNDPIGYRYAFWCSTLTGCIGYCHEWNFLDAMNMFDYSIILGLPVTSNENNSESKMKSFLYYVELHAYETAKGPYPPYFHCIVPDYMNHDHNDITTMCWNDYLSNPIRFPIEETTVISSHHNFFTEYTSQSIPIVYRGYASDWLAINKWRDLHFWAREHGHRLVPLEIGSMMISNDYNEKNNDPCRMKETVQSFRTFIESFLIPSTTKGYWNLNDAVQLSSSSSSSGNTTPCQVAYLAQHPLLHQITSLLNDIQMKPNLLCNDGMRDDDIPYRIHVSFGTGGTRTPLHYDSYDNLFVQIVGIKYIRLYHPNESKYLYVVQKNVNRYNSFMKDNEQMKSSSSTSTSSSSSLYMQGNISEINCEIEDDGQHPNVKLAKYTEAILYPGDTLYIPSRTWHYTRSITTSISINCWF